MQSRKISALLFIALLAATTASAAGFNTKLNPQAKDNISGKYTGVAKSDQLGDIPITVSIKNDGGKLTGSIDTPQGPFAITSGTVGADGKVSLKFDAGGNEGVVTAMLAGDKITGKWDLAGTGGPLELKRADAVAAGPAPASSAGGSSTPAAAAGGDLVSGDWDATADAQGTSIPFTLKLKLEGDKVTGTSESPQGAFPLSKGSYTGGKLSFTLATGQADIVMTGTIKDGKITGDYDFAGQMTGKWEAKKK